MLFRDEGVGPRGDRRDYSFFLGLHVDLPVSSPSLRLSGNKTISQGPMRASRASFVNNENMLTVFQSQTDLGNLRNCVLGELTSRRNTFLGRRIPYLDNRL